MLLPLATEAPLTHVLPVLSLRQLVTVTMNLHNVVRDNGVGPAFIHFVIHYLLVGVVLSHGPHRGLLRQFPHTNLMLPPPATEMVGHTDSALFAITQFAQSRQNKSIS